MLKELSWYLEKNRFSNIVRELDESVKAYESALNNGTDDADGLREKARRLFEDHCLRSGLRTEENSYINIDAEFFEGKKIDQTALDDFIKNILKAHGYQQILWTHMGTTGSFTVISKDEMKRQGLNYEDYLPVEYKKKHPQNRPSYIKPKKDTVNLYVYSDGTISDVYDREKAKLRFDALQDTSGVQWNKGYDPNGNVIKKGWHGAFDETGTWVKVTEEKKENEPGARQYMKVQPIRIVADGDTAILYDPADILFTPAELLYLTDNGELYGALDVDREKTVEEIRASLKDMGLTQIGIIGSPKANHEEAQKAYEELLKDMLTPDCKVQEVKEVRSRIEEKKEKEEALKEEKEGVKLERTIELIRQNGKTAPEAIAALAAGTMVVPLTIRKKEDAKALGLTDKEAGEIAKYEAPAGKEEEFTSALANIFAAWPVYEKTGLNKLEMADRVYDELSGKTSEDPLTTEILLRDILLPAGAVTAAGLYSTGMPGVFTEEKPVDFSDESEKTAFIHGLEKNNVLPVGGSAATFAALATLTIPSGAAQKAILNRALTRALSQYKAIAMSTGMPIREIIQTAAKAAAGELPDTTLGRRIAYELSTSELTQNASRENRQEQELPIDDIFSKTLKPQATTTVIIGGVSGTALSMKGFDKKSLQETYGYSAQEAQKTEELLHEIRLADTLPPETLADIVSMTENSLKQEKSTGALRKTLYKNIGTLPGVSYNLRSDTGRNAYMGSERANGIDREIFEDLTQTRYSPATYIPNAMPLGTRTVEPVYRSRGRVVPATRTAKRGTPETIHSAYRDTDGEIRPYTVPMAFSGGGSMPAAKPSRESVSAPSVSNQASAETPLGLNGMLSPKPMRQAEDPELARLRRMEANYEHDKAMMVRERQPALARSDTHEVGHAEELILDDKENLKKIANEHFLAIKQELERRQG